MKRKRKRITKKPVPKKRKPSPRKPAKPAHKKRKPAPRKPAKSAPKRRKPAPRKPAPKKRKKETPRPKAPRGRSKKHIKTPEKRKPLKRDPRQWNATKRAAEDGMSAIIDGAFDTKSIAKGAIQIVRVPLIDYPMRAKSAIANGWEPERLAERIDALPQMPFTGKRRCLVRAMAWLIDDEDETAYDPQWITLIPKYAPTDGQSLRMAFLNAGLWLRHYIDSLHQYTASKLLRFTMLEVAFWPMGPRSPTNGHPTQKRKRGKTR